MRHQLPVMVPALLTQSPSSVSHICCALLQPVCQTLLQAMAETHCMFGMSPDCLAQNISMHDTDTMLNKRSGFQGLAGTSDLRSVLEACDAGDERAQIAYKVSPPRCQVSWRRSPAPEHEHARHRHCAQEVQRLPGPGRHFRPTQRAGGL